MEVGDLAGRGLRCIFGCDEHFLSRRLLEYLARGGAHCGGKAMAIHLLLRWRRGRHDFPWGARDLGVPERRPTEGLGRPGLRHLLRGLSRHRWPLPGVEIWTGSAILKARRMRRDGLVVEASQAGAVWLDW